jgi:ribose 5-phosphate isomerase A
VTDRDALKRAAAEQAAAWVESGMVVGLGTGTTAIHAINGIAARLRDGSLTDVVGIPTSRASEEAARELGIPLTTLAEHPVVDLTIDGADEVDPALDLIKGGGAALLHEKVLAQASLREVIDHEAKCRAARRASRPVEVPARLASRGGVPHDLGAEVMRRPYDEPVLTDEGN